MSEPVSHVSYYEAAAFANWSGSRLATEFEWEAAAKEHALKEGNYYEAGIFHPIQVRENYYSPGESIVQLSGDAWEWTSSTFSPYPQFKIPKENCPEFSIRSIVLKGHSCLSSIKSYRHSSRLSLDPESRGYCSGIRLVKDIL